MTYPNETGIIKNMDCPHCGHDIPIALFSAHLGRLNKGKTSEAKAKASRENGKLGGRPPKKKGKKR